MEVALINNLDDYKICIDLIEQENIHSYNFFTIDNLPPYLVDINLDLKNLCKWKEFGIKDFNSNRFWMENYSEIESVVSKYVKDNSFNNNYFKFGIIMSFTWGMLLPLHEFAGFTKTYKVKKIIMKRENANLVNVFSEFIRNSGIQLELY